MEVYLFQSAKLNITLCWETFAWANSAYMMEEDDY